MRLLQAKIAFSLQCAADVLGSVDNSNLTHLTIFRATKAWVSFWGCSKDCRTSSLKVYRVSRPLIRYRISDALVPDFHNCNKKEKNRTPILSITGDMPNGYGARPIATETRIHDQNTRLFQTLMKFLFKVYISSRSVSISIASELLMHLSALAVMPSEPSRWFYTALTESSNFFGRHYRTLWFENQYEWLMPQQALRKL